MTGDESRRGGAAVPEELAVPEDLPMPECLAEPAFRSRLGDGRLGRLFDYWSARRVDGRLPSRDAVDPAELTRLLPWIYLVEPAGAGFRVRLAGTRIRELFDYDITGKDLAAELPRPFADNAARSYRTVVEQRCGWLSVVESRLDSGRLLLYRRIALPLSSDGAAVDRVLGLVDWDEWLTVGQPFWELWDEAVERRRSEAVCRLAIPNGGDPL